MKLQDPMKQHPPFDVAVGAVQMYLNKGYTKVEPTTAKPIPNSKCGLKLGTRVEDYQYPPMLFWSCSTCGGRHWTEIEIGTAHKTSIARHCGVVETCPPEIAAQYEKIFAEWHSRKKRAPEKGSAFSSNPRNLPLGLQEIPGLGKITL